MIIIHTHSLSLTFPSSISDKARPVGKKKKRRRKAKHEHCFYYHQKNQLQHRSAWSKSNNVARK